MELVLTDSLVGMTEEISADGFDLPPCPTPTRPPPNKLPNSVIKLLRSV